MNIAQWPPHDRPREKLLQHGARTLTDTELLAILINTGTQKANAVDLARTLLHHHKSLTQLFSASAQELAQTPGIGQAKYAVLQASLELCQRYLSRPQQATYIRSIADATSFFERQLMHQQQEVFACLFLGYKQQLLGYEALYQGTINRTPIHAREVARFALKYNATFIILGHNHPTGTADPSTADIQATNQLIKELAPLEIRIIDHIIISDKECTSFIEKGLM
jgi:DNA repair protein RadC